MSLQLMKSVLRCSECIITNLSHEPAQKPQKRDYDSFQEVWERCQEVYCPQHARLWVEDIFLPLVNSYHRNHNEEAGLPSADDIISMPLDQKMLDDILFEMRVDRTLWIIKEMLRPSRVTTPMASIKKLFEYLRNSVALDDEDHVDTLLQHVLNTLHNTGELTYEGHMLDIVSLAQTHPDVVWSQRESGDVRRHHLMMSMALKVFLPEVIGQGFARRMEWMVSAIIARFYGASINNLATLETHIKESVPAYQADWEYILQVHPYREGSYIKRFGETCNLLFDWVEFIRSREGEEEMSIDRVMPRVLGYRGFIRPRSLQTLARRVRSSEYMEVEFSEDRLILWMDTLSTLGDSSSTIVPDPDDIATFDMDIKTYLEWDKNGYVYRNFKGTHVDTYDRAREWILSFGQHGISQDRLRELAMTGIPLAWVLATHGKA